MKKYIKKFKELWANPRYKALLKLGLWFIFIAILVSMVRTGAEVKETINPKIESYEVVYKITSEDKNYTVNGVHFKEKEKLIMDTYTYYYVDNILNYQNSEAPDIEKISFGLLDYNSLKEKLSKTTQIDETTYTNKKVISYIISDSYFNTLEDANVVAEYESDNLTKVTISFNGLENYQIEIEYKNFNTITNLDINI